MPFSKTSYKIRCDAGDVFISECSCFSLSLQHQMLAPLCLFVYLRRDHPSSGSSSALLSLGTVGNGKAPKWTVLALTGMRGCDPQGLCLGSRGGMPTIEAGCRSISHGLASCLLIRALCIEPTIPYCLSFLWSKPTKQTKLHK